MAFQQHDPRYAQSPYHFQPPFPPPQQHNAFGLGHPVAQPPLAPPQAYLTNRPQPPYTPHSQVAGQSGFPGAFPNAGQYQHNAQYNPNMVAGQAHMGYQAPQQMPPQQMPPQFYNAQAFRNGPPPPPGQMPSLPANSPPNIIPPPPSQAQQQANNAFMQWPNNPGLPPKPPSVGYRESVELPSAQHSAQGQGGLPGIGGATGVNNAGNVQHAAYPPNTQNNGTNPASTQSQSTSSAQNGTFEHRQAQADFYHPSQQQNSAQAPYSPAGPSTSNLAVSNTDRENRAEESPDMYSPQLHPQHLPGLGGMVAETSPSQTQTARDDSRFKGNDGNYSPPAAIPVLALAKASDVPGKPQAPPMPSIDPFAIKDKASQALRDLDANNIGFLDIAGNGVHPNVLRNLYLELGLELDPVKAKAKETPKKAPALKVAPKPAPAAPGATKAASVQVKKPVTQAPSKPLTREEYLAKLKAAKGDKVSPPTASNEPSPAPKSVEQPKPAEVITIGSDSGASATTEKTEAPPKPPPPKKVDVKSEKQNALIRQRLEALKKQTIEKQQREAEEAAKAAANPASAPAPTALKPVQTPKASNTVIQKSNGEYTPANPYYASSSSFSGLPGLSMFDDPATALPGFDHPVDEDEPEDELENGEIVDESDEAQAQVVTSPTSRKRSREDESYVARAPISPQVDAHKQQQFIIELSDDEEEGEVTSSADHPDTALQLAAQGTDLDSAQDPMLQSRLQALAAHEESIKVYKQKIELLEAKKRAKKAVSSNATPTPSVTPSQIKPLAQIPEAVRSTVPSTALAAAGEKVQAQQDSFVATKSVLVQRLEQEEARVTAGESTPRKNQQQERIKTLRASITKLDSEIAQAETEKQRIQQEIERGIKGREEFSKELSELLAEMEAEDSAAKEAVQTHGADIDELFAGVEDEAEPDDHADDLDDDAGDDTMDISEDEEGEISEDERPDPGAEYPVDIRERSPDEYEPALEETHQQHSEPASEEIADEPETAYSPQAEQSTPESDDVEMEYELDEYDPEEFSPEAIEDDYEPQDGPREFEPEGPEALANTGTLDERVPENVEARGPSQESGVDDEQPSAGASQDHEASPLPVVSVSDSSANSDDDGSEEGEMAEDEDNDDEPGGDEYDPDSARIIARAEPDAELVLEDHSPEEDLAEPEEMVMDESSDSEPSHDEGTRASGFRPYESPLAVFKSYRFAPQYARLVPGGFKSLTYSHRINPNEPFCQWELQGGICADAKCSAQHFRDTTLTDDKLILELGSLNEGATDEQRNEYREGLRKLLTSLREKGVSSDPVQIASELAAYRLRFWGDPTRVVTRIGSGL